MTELINEASKLLNDKYAHKLAPDEAIRLEIIENESGLTLKGLVGTTSKAHVFELLIRQLDDREDAILFLLDYFDAVLGTFLRQQRRGGFSLDFSQREFEGTILFVRQEYHDFEAERLADELLAADDAKKS